MLECAHNHEHRQHLFDIRHGADGPNNVMACDTCSGMHAETLAPTSRCEQLC